MRDVKPAVLPKSRLSGPRWLILVGCAAAVFTIHSQEMVAVEALLRWNNPKLGQASPVEFKDRGFLQLVESVLEEYQLPGSVLEIEVTENVLLSDRVNAVDLLSNLGKLGISISMDDFGTGHDFGAWSPTSILRCCGVGRLQVASFSRRSGFSRDGRSRQDVLLSQLKQLLRPYFDVAGWVGCRRLHFPVGAASAVMVDPGRMCCYRS